MTVSLLGAAVEAAAPVVRGAPYLVVEHVGKRFDRFSALSDVSLTINTGEFVAFLGPSGCGKTTLLRAIAGLDPPSEGRVVQAGRDITGLPPSQRDFGIVFQSYALFPNLSVTDNVAYGLRGAAWPKPRRNERVAELLQLVGLPEQARKFPAQLSGGQQQRVALARALAPEPGLILLDEPLSALDAIVRLNLRQELRALQRRLGVTTIMVTHDQEEAMAVADRIAVLNGGRLEQVGTPEEIYRQPSSPFVASFIGRSTAFDATVEAGALVTRDGHRIPAPARLAEGASCRAYLRPEDLRLGQDALALPGNFEATLIGIEYLGAICRLTFEDRSLRLDGEADPDEMRALGLAAGSRIPVALPADRLMVFTLDV
jgi:iron(III) transport system ATP-binding protein